MKIKLFQSPTVEFGSLSVGDTFVDPSSNQLFMVIEDIEYESGLCINAICLNTGEWQPFILMSDVIPCKCTLNVEFSKNVGMT